MTDETPPELLRKTMTLELLDSIPINSQRTPCAEKHDRLGWKAGFSLTHNGLTVGVRTNEPALTPHLRAMFPEFMEPSEKRLVSSLLSLRVGGAKKRKGVRNLNVVYNNWTPIARAEDLDEALEVFANAVRALGDMTSNVSIYIEGEAVSWNDRAIIVLSSPKGGATTLCDILCAAGAVRYASELIIVTPEGLIHSSDTPALPLLVPGLVLLTDYNPSQKIWRPRKLSPGETVMSLFARSPAASSVPELVLLLLSKLQDRCVAFEGTRGEASSLLPFIAKQIKFLPPTQDARR